MIGSPLGLIALLAVPTVIAIHMFRRRFKRRPVAGLFLWVPPQHDPSSGRRLHRLERSLSLLLETLLALFLALYLIDFRLDDAPGVDNVVVVVDSSASMSAVASSSRHDVAAAARERIAEIVDDAGRRVQISIVATGARPRLIAGPAAPKSVALAALETWTPSARAHDLRPSLDLARELAGPGATVHVVTDRLPQDGETLGDARTHVHAVGRAMANASLLASRRERTEVDGVDEVFLRIGHASDAEGVISLKIRAHDRLVHDQAVALAPDAETRVTIPIDAGDADLVVELGEDSLAADNRAILVRPPKREVLVRLDLEDDVVRGILERTIGAIADMRLAGEDETAHLYVAGPDIDPVGFPELWWCRLGPFPAKSDAPSEAKDLEGPFLFDRSHPLLEDVWLTGVIWGGARPGGEDLWPLVSTSDRVLAGLRPREEGMELFLNLDPRRSSLHRTSDWPVLFNNLARLRRAALPGAQRSNLRVGDDLTVNLPDELPAAPRLVLPDGAERDLPVRRRVVLDRLDQAGVYELRVGDDVLHRFAASFHDAAEADVRDAGSGEREPVEAQRELREGESYIDPRLHFPLVALVLIVFLWNIVHLQRARRPVRAAEGTA